MVLSILSRFYFYDDYLLPFMERKKFFQSYQGSIFTIEVSCKCPCHYSFQSYQGSIFTVVMAVMTTAFAYFQSYQGSIFTKLQDFQSVGPMNFQSYQGSIFTRVNNPAWWDPPELSILSRFYFYQVRRSAL